MKTLMYGLILAIALVSCQSKKETNANSQDSLPQKQQKEQDGEQEENTEATRKEKIKATLQDYCAKLSNADYEAAIKDNFAPKVGQYIQMRQTTPNQIAAEVKQFLSEKQGVSYKVNLDKLKVMGYLAEVPLTFSWKGYFATVLLELSFDQNFKIAFYKEAKIYDRAVIEFSQQKYYEGENGCEDGSIGCTYYAVEYPKIINAPAHLRDLLPGKPHEYGYVSGFRADTPEGVLPKLVKKRAESSDDRNWYIDNRSYVRESKYLITVEQRIRFLVGNEPQSAISIEYYDKRTGKEVRLRDLLINDAMEDFEEVAFQTVIGEQKTECRDDFSLSRHFRILDKGIELCYAKESEMPCLPTQRNFLIPYQKFKYIIRKDGLLRDKIK